MKATLGLPSVLGGRRRLEDSRAFLLIAVAVAMTTEIAPVTAASFGSVSYDPNGDQLIVAMIYDGTNPNHHFSVQMGVLPQAQRARPARAPDNRREHS